MAYFRDRGGADCLCVCVAYVWRSGADCSTVDVLEEEHDGGLP